MKTRLLSFVLALLPALAAQAVDFRVVNDHTNLLYHVGETASFTVTALEKDGSRATNGCYLATLDNYGPAVQRKETVDLAKTNPFILTGSLAESGFLRLTVRAAEDKKDAGFVWSVGYDPEGIRKGSPSPADFDAFWSAARARLAREVPLDAQMTRVEERSTRDFDFYRISFATFGRRVHGYLSVPKDTSRAPYPVEIQVSAAGFGPWTNNMDGRADTIKAFFGVYPFAPDWDWEKHGLKASYDAMEASCHEKFGTGYPQSGIALGREDYFFYPVILGLDRAIDWIAARPDADPHDFRYQGTSQGGGLGMCLVALNSHFTRAGFFVPAITDTMGYLKGRRSGWPQLIESQRPENKAAAERNAPYFDAANFASRIRCPVRVAVGFADMTCSPSAVYAAYNEMPVADKRIYHGFGMGHGCRAEFYKAIGEWLRLAPHPRLLANARDFDSLAARLAASETGRRGYAALLESAESLLTARAPVYQKDASGRRILGISREMVSEIGKLALAYRLTHKRAYAEKAIAQARAAAAFDDWNPSHFLDTAEMTFAEALCYDWLYDALSPDDRAAIAGAIRSKGLLGPDGRLAGGSWVKGNNNWAQICHGGLVAGAVATLEVNPEISRQVIDRAVECLPIPMAVFAPDGGFPEGAGGYWQYAMEYNILAIWAIEKLDGTDHGLCARPGFAREVDFLGSCTGPTGALFNFSDAGGARAPKLSPTYAQAWLVRRFDRPDAALSLGFDARDRFFPLQLLTYEEPSEAAARRAPLARVIRGENPIAVMRTAWDDPEAWYAGLKGGRVSCSHGHMDVGSFVLEAKGVRWAYDLGCESYSKVEAAKVDLWNSCQDSPRWDLFRYALRGHGTLQFNDERQKIDATAEFAPLVESAESTSATLDLSSVYGRSVKRTFTLGKKGGFAVADAIRGAKPGERVTWRLNTFAEVALAGNVATLTAKNARGEVRRMRLTAEPADSVFEAVDHAKREHDYEADNPGLRQLQFVRTVPASGALDLKVSFE